LLHALSNTCSFRFRQRASCVHLLARSIHTCARGVALFCFLCFVCVCVCVFRTRLDSPTRHAPVRRSSMICRWRFQQGACRRSSVAAGLASRHCLRCCCACTRQTEGLFSSTVVTCVLLADPPVCFVDTRVTLVGRRTSLAAPSFLFFTHTTLWYPTHLLLA
jgi:hypothetical protein